MADFEKKEQEDQRELSVEVVSDTSSEPEVELVKITEDDAPLGETIDLSGCVVGGYCPVCNAPISIDISNIKEE